MLTTAAAMTTTTNANTVVSLTMEPQNGTIDLSKTALLIIDMQASAWRRVGCGA